MQGSIPEKKLSGEYVDDKHGDATFISGFSAAGGRRSATSSELESGAQQTQYDEDGVERVAPENDLHRGLKARQISMIALGGAIGTGLVIGLSRGGPVGLLLAYVVMGTVCFGVLASLGEMATLIPHKKGFSGYASRFVDPAMGFATGWNYLFKYLVVTPNNITVRFVVSLKSVHQRPAADRSEELSHTQAASIVIQYWTRAVPVGAWITIFNVIIIVINLLGIKVFGEIEFWLSFFKIIVLTGLILLGWIIDLGGVPGQGRIGFRYWRDQPFAHYIYNTDTGVFLGVWSCMTTALFAYMGCELIGVTFGEAKNPRKTIPKTIRRTFWRLLIFYVGSIFVVGLIVSANDPDLLTANKRRTSAAASPFVVAIQRAGIKVLPDIINASILMFVMSAANSDLYIGSRTLYALAAESKAPKIFMRTNRYGTPYIALAFCSAFCCLAYMNVAAEGAQVFTYFTALVTIFGALTWLSILVSHVRFMKGLKVQGISRDTLPWQAPLQPYLAYFSIVVTSIVTLFKGFDAFMPNFKFRTFITAYLGLPIYVILYTGWKIYHRTSIIPLAELDFVSGRREFDEDEAAEEAAANKHTPLWKKIWQGA
ncbi:BZ3500_MvSof-1268-A1-R1_Chr10-1g02690 [Microbotryum saponariae]|uniref:BZ3500_MvSof-1268-A1-R1_Chr10-1g02690 protein n=1 Tax=Microbotryum saponariae TaxID=289078 RepID=A0A2X0N337_9BASI|nr:BZ3500_MvSof-1268-A1-R1_Chr10-1g02690 [Microbotryum saponariae]SDA06179.1 BZ3501_MvSof-1269-A2-R1_Chr10-1g02291 [Microbotryum saponariae]